MGTVASSKLGDVVPVSAPRLTMASPSVTVTVPVDRGMVVAVVVPAVKNLAVSVPTMNFCPVATPCPALTVMVLTPFCPAPSTSAPRGNTHTTRDVAGVNTALLTSCNDASTRLYSSGPTPMLASLPHPYVDRAIHRPTPPTPSHV